MSWEDGPLTRDALRGMPARSLQRMAGVCIERAGVGSIAFLAPVDLTAAALGDIVRISAREVEVYPARGSVRAPEVGCGLNVPARVTLHNIYPCRGDGAAMGAARAAAFAERLRARMHAQGAHGVQYDAAAGTLVFEVDHF